MAQWLGQFTGNTHGTRVKDAEETLAGAVRAFQACPSDERPRRAKALRKIAERVLRARLQFLKARLSVLHSPTATGAAAHATQAAGLRDAQEAANAGGVEAILREFGLQNVAVPALTPTTR